MAQYNRRLITAFIYLPLHSLLFGIGLLIVLWLIPRWSEHLSFWISTVVIVTWVIAVPIAWLVAPRLQARYDRRRQAGGLPAALSPESSSSTGHGAPHVLGDAPTIEDGPHRQRRR
jgi:MFS superfamily sulfate permease-like transporter